MQAAISQTSRSVSSTESPRPTRWVRPWPSRTPELLRRYNAEPAPKQIAHAMGLSLSCIHRALRRLRQRGTLPALTRRQRAAIAADERAAERALQAAEAARAREVRDTDILARWLAPSRPSGREIARAIKVTPGVVAGVLHRLRLAGRLPKRDVPDAEAQRVARLRAGIAARSPEAEATRIARIRQTLTSPALRPKLAARRKRGPSRPAVQTVPQATPAPSPPPAEDWVPAPRAGHVEPCMRCGEDAVRGRPFCVACSRTCFVAARGHGKPHHTGERAP
jgi:DNA-binding MarR family transcriptional regulator